MSVPRGCKVIERHPNRWYCVVAQAEYDYDFSGDAIKYGPKPTADEALDLMGKHEANPGSFHRVEYGALTQFDRELCDNLPTNSGLTRRPYWRT